MDHMLLLNLEGLFYFFKYTCTVSFLVHNIMNCMIQKSFLGQ